MQFSEFDLRKESGEKQNNLTCSKALVVSMFTTSSLLLGLSVLSTVYLVLVAKIIGYTLYL
jgi:hypothetical protein